MYTDRLTPNELRFMIDKFKAELRINQERINTYEIVIDNLNAEKRDAHGDRKRWAILDRRIGNIKLIVRDLYITRVEFERNLRDCENRLYRIEPPRTTPLTYRPITNKGK